MKVLYLYSGTRDDKFKGKSSVDYPDTQFYGLQHLECFGIQAEYKEFESIFGKTLAKILGFRIKHFFMYFIARKYDIVFGISVIYLLIWKKFIPTRTKFVIFNSVLNRMLIVYKQDTFMFGLLSWILKDVDGIIFPARVHMNRVVEKLPFLRSKAFFVPLGVDAVYYKPVYFERENFILSVGRDNGRDYKTVIDVARKMPDEQFHIVCLPRNIEGIESIPSNVKIHINIPMSELQRMYRKAKLLLLIMHNDSYVDGSDTSGPTVLLEAMAIGLPIIVSRKEYLNDYVENNKSALIVDFYNVDNIIENIKKMTDINFRENIARNSREKIDIIYNTKVMAKSFADIFKIIYERK